MLTDAPTRADIDHALLKMEGQREGITRAIDIIDAAPSDMPKDAIQAFVKDILDGVESGIDRLRTSQRRST